MKKAGTVILALVCVLVIVAVATVFGADYYWTRRGDNIQVSPTGSLGWGSTPIMAKAGKESDSPTYHIATVRSFLFIRDLSYLPPPPGMKATPMLGGPGAAVPPGANPHS